MKLVTEELEKTFSEYPLYSQDGKGGEAVVIAKYFNPYGSGTWYVLEAEKQDDGDYLFFGYVESPITPEFNEYGYFTLKQLEDLKIPFKSNGEVVFVGTIERDLYLSDLKMKDVLNR